MAYDRDGSELLFYQSSSSPTTLSSGQRISLNNETFGNVLNWHQYYDGSRYLVIIFPELRDVRGLLLGLYADVISGGAGYMNGQIAVSSDTTNGIDGTWTNQGHGYGLGLEVRNPTKEKLRENIGWVNFPAVKAVRLHLNFSSDYTGDVRIRNFHVYGSPASGAAPDRLRIWHPTLDQEVAGDFFDWQDVARSTVLDKWFRIKNPSASLTANGVTVAMEALTDTTPTNVSQHTLSSDGGSTFDSSASVGNLGPGDISGLVQLRRTTLAGAVIGLWWTRLVVTASSWT